MKYLPNGYRAVVAGSTGGIGRAFIDLLEQDSACDKVIGLSRSTDPTIDFANEGSIEHAANQIGEAGSVHLIIDATGFLSDAQTQPEKSLRTLNPENMMKLFTANTIGPALLMKHFAPLLPRNEPCLFATLSARVGSIGDNSLGGWYSYRASKAALNMVLKTASVEIARKNEQAICVALHPGTVETALSDPFAGSRDRLTAGQSASMMLGVLNELKPEHIGSFLAYDGSAIEW